MEISINGKFIQTKQNNIEGLILELSLSHEGLVLLHNDKIINKTDYPKLILQDSDRVELLNFVSGG